MFEGVGYYFMFLLLFQPIEEFYTCNNPNTISNGIHILCEWEDEDFRKLPNGNRVLKRIRSTDSFVKEYYRQKYWIIREQGTVFKSKREGVGVKSHPILLGIF